MTRVPGRTKYLPLLFFALLALWSPLGGAAEGAFTPLQPTILAGDIKAGDTGYMLTVLSGTKPERIPVKVVNVIPQSRKGEVKDLILIRLLSRTVELARGMSGSPVYIKGKLAGAVASGWSFSDHGLALVTPIADMCAVFDYEGAKSAPRAAARGVPPTAGDRLASVAVSGLSSTSAALLGRALGMEITASPTGARGELPVEPSAGAFAPGDAVAALLAWGDVEVAGTGTVTATSKDGRFLAFGHPFLKRGNVGYPAARAVIHDTVKSQIFPFKLASPLSIAGAIVQDREAGIGGRTGFFVPSIAAALSFRDGDRGTRDERNFRVIAEPFLSAKLLEGIYAGLVEDAWGRKGQGTMNVTLRVEGRGIQGSALGRNSWTRSDVFYSDEDVGAAALKQATQIMNAVLTQPFVNTMPLGFRLDVEAVEEPRALLIEDVQAPSSARAGEEFPVTVTLRPWRGQPVSRDFTLKVPEGASGVCELIVRGGGVHPLPQLALEGGWKSIDSLDRMLREIGAMDANNELLIELTTDIIADALKKSSNKDKDQRDGPDLLPEETEYLSETKERRIKEGTLRIFRSDRFVDGMMKRLVTVEESEDDAPAPARKAAGKRGS